MANVVRWSSLAFVLVAAGCGRDSIDETDTRVAGSLRITPAGLNLFVGQRFAVDVLQETNGRDRSVLGRSGLVLVTRDPSVATVRTDGQGIAEGPGETTLEARWDGRVARTTLTVLDAQLQALFVEPQVLSLEVGQARRLQVFGRLDNGTSIDLTANDSGTTYRIAEGANVATIDADGLVRGVAAGDAVIEIRNLDFVVLAFVEVIVGRNLVEIFVEPPEVFVGVGTVGQLRVFGRFADGSAIEISDASLGTVYASEAPDILAVGPNGELDARGRFDSALSVLVRNGRLETTARVFIVDEAFPIALEVEPQPLDLLVGDFVPLRVTAAFSDGTRRDVTNDPGLTITTLPGDIVINQGAALIAVTAGRTQILVDYRGLAIVVPVVISEASAIVGLDLTTAREVAVGQTSPVSVFALLADGRLRDITLEPDLVVESSDLSILTTSNVSVRGISIGTAEVSARYRGFIDAAPVSVIDDAIVSVAFSAAPSVAVAVAGTTTVNVIATRASGRTEIVTSRDDLSLASNSTVFDFAIGTTGIVLTGLQSGAGTLTAQLEGATATLEVSVDGQVSLTEIRLTAPRRLAVGAEATLTVTAVFSDGSNRDVTDDPQTQLTSLDSDIVTVDGPIARGVSVGSTTIRAEFTTASSTVVIEVTDDPDGVQSIAFVPAGLVVLQGSLTEPATLRAETVGGGTFDITADPEVALLISGPVSLSQATRDGYRFTADAAGTARVEASFRGATTSLDIVVLPFNVEPIGLTLTAPGSLQRGTSGSYRVTADFSDGSTLDVTDSPQTSAVTDPAGIITAEAGRLTAISAGTTTLRVTFGDQSAQRLITVVDTDDPLRFLAFSPAQLALDVDDRASIQLLGFRQSGAQVDLTSDARVRFTVLGPLTLDPTPLVVVGVAPGGFGQVNATFVGLTAALPVSVGGAPSLIDVVVTPTGPLILSPGDERSLTVTGLFSDGGQQSVTNAAFFSIDARVATVDAEGIVRGAGVGTTTVVVAFGPFVRLVTVDVASGR